MNRSQAIKAHCLECSGNSSREVTTCALTDCPLYPYRFGNNPRAPAYKKRMEALKVPGPVGESGGAEFINPQAVKRPVLHEKKAS